MTGRATDRKKKDQKQADTPAEAFVLPDSLPTSEVDFPILVRKSRKAKWNDILETSRRFHQSLQEFVDREPTIRCPFKDTESDYIAREVFAQLIPALDETLIKAKIWDVLGRQRSFFNGIDHIAQTLWNNNPRHPTRKEQDLHIFNMPWARKYLKEHPRPIYPKSWLWTEEYAAVIIQKSIRQYFVQKQEEVQEMRSFWEKLAVEKFHPEVDTNPFLAKHLASSIIIHRYHHNGPKNQKNAQQHDQPHVQLHGQQHGQQHQKPPS